MKLKPTANMLLLCKVKQSILDPRLHALQLDLYFLLCYPAVFFIVGHLQCTRQTAVKLPKFKIYNCIFKEKNNFLPYARHKSHSPLFISTSKVLNQSPLCKSMPRYHMSCVTDKSVNCGFNSTLLVSGRKWCQSTIYSTHTKGVSVLRWVVPSGMSHCLLSGTPCFHSDEIRCCHLP